MGRDSYRVYDPATLSGHETEKAKARRAAAAAATSGHRRTPRPPRAGERMARPAPMHDPAITIDARGRMYRSPSVGIKTIGRSIATTAGKNPPKRSRRCSTAPLLNRNRLPELDVILGAEVPLGTEATWRRCWPHLSRSSRRPGG